MSRSFWHQWRRQCQGDETKCSQSSYCSDSCTCSKSAAIGSSHTSQAESLIHVHVKCAKGQTTILQDIRDAFLPLDIHYIRNVYEMVPGSVWDFLIECDHPSELAKKVQKLHRSPSGCALEVSVCPVSSDEAFNTEMTERFLKEL